MYQNLLKHTAPPAMEPAIEMEPVLLELEGEAVDLMAQIKTYIPNADAEGVLSAALYDMEGFEGLMGTLDYTSAEDLRTILGKVQNVRDPLPQPAWRIGFHRSQGERLELREVWLDSREELINAANDYGDYSRQLTHYSSEDLIPRRVESVEMTEFRQDVLERRVVNLDEPEPATRPANYEDWDSDDLLADDDDFAREVDAMMDEEDLAQMERMGREDPEFMELAEGLDQPYEVVMEDLAAYDEVVELEPLLRPLLPFNVEAPVAGELVGGGCPRPWRRPSSGRSGAPSTG